MSPSPAPYEWVAGHPAIDFANTEVMVNGQASDRLHDFAGLLAWCEAAGLLSAGERAVLSGENAGPRAHQRAFAQALELRALLRRTLETLAQGRKAPAAALAFINTELSRQRIDTRLVVEGESYRLRETRLLESPADVLPALAATAADLLVSCNPRLIRKCEARDCILYFYDTTKNHRRRWCSMSACGNRAKAAAHYRRRKAAGDGHGDEP